MISSFDKERLFGRASVPYWAIEPTPGAWSPVRADEAKMRAVLLVWQYPPGKHPSNEETGV
jgi:hypothetical protein